MDERALLEAVHASPADPTIWLALADCLEEQGEAERAELLRLRQTLLALPAPGDRDALEDRLRALLAPGVRPAVPLLVNSVGMELALIPPGSFLMGSPESEEDRYADEGPLRTVTISRPFYLGVYSVIQTEYERVMGSNPSSFRPGGSRAQAVEGLDTSRFPVEGLSWPDAAAFCERLSALPEERRAGRIYRLPSEAEWEYACRAGTSTPFHFGRSISHGQANFDTVHPYPPEDADSVDFPLSRPAPVGSYLPNAFGVFDMHGNMQDWCADWYASDYYQNAPAVDPPGPAEGERRILRGGGWDDWGEFCRAAFRYDHPPDGAQEDFGVRVAMTLARP
jgi:uncharacterized protein (TIGR02996 family)